MKISLNNSDPKGGAGRGIVSTCSYEARKYGIHSAMPISQAYKLFPDAVFLPVNVRLYVQVSDNVVEIMKGFAEKFQQYSIDEDFLVPGLEIMNFEEAVLCALRIRDEIKRQERITCSVRVGPNKLIAKIASKFRKPNGLTERFGKMDMWLKRAAHNIDLSEVEESEEAVKSISWSSTFKEDTSDPIKIAGYLVQLLYTCFLLFSLRSYQSEFILYSVKESFT